MIVGTNAACVFASCDLGAERIERWGGTWPQPGEPPLEFGQGPGIQFVQAPVAVSMHYSKMVVPQYFQVLRDGRLRDPELTTDHVAQVSGHPWALGEHFEYPATHRIRQNLETVHHPTI